MIDVNLIILILDMRRYELLGLIERRRRRKKEFLNIFTFALKKPKPQTYGLTAVHLPNVLSLV